VYDGANLHLYGNGNLLGSQSETMGLGGSSDNALFMGSDESGSDRHWRGKLDDIRIYAQALALTEIRLIAESVPASPLAELKQ
ncbi:MAG: LamG-like jellyroll fold domain-containing protein, partial [bacterium]|nr:LamG-like jellyroll fold domain-containing protein [bacterium]